MLPNLFSASWAIATLPAPATTPRFRLTFVLDVIINLRSFYFTMSDVEGDDVVAIFFHISYSLGSVQKGLKFRKGREPLLKVPVSDVVRLHPGVSLSCGYLGLAHGQEFPAVEVRGGLVIIHGARVKVLVGRPGLASPN